MFSKPQQVIEPIYQPFKPLFTGNMEQIYALQQKGFTKLSESAWMAVEEKKFEDAFINAAALRYLFGVPGLLLTHQIFHKSFIEREKEGEYLESAVTNALINLLLAEYLLIHDPQAVSDLHHYLPSENIDEKNYFKKKKTELLNFCELSPDQLQFCERTALELATECASKRSKPVATYLSSQK